MNKSEQTIPAWKVTVSGTYYTVNHEVVDFEKLTGFIPQVADDLINMQVQGRYLRQWIENARNADGSKPYPQPYVGMQRVYIDAYDATDHAFSFIGRAIQDFTAAEVQDLATLYDFRGVPLYKGNGLRDSRVKLWQHYCQMQGDPKELWDDNKYASSQPEIITIDLVAPRRDNEGRKTLSPEELQREFDPDTAPAVEDAEPVRAPRAAPGAPKPRKAVTRARAKTAKT